MYLETEGEIKEQRMWNIEGQNSSDPVNPQQATGSSFHEGKQRH